MCENAFARLDRIKKSGINEAFVPMKPVNTNFFCGRSKEVEKIVTDIINPGAHVLLYGDRGVGKTSLAVHSCEQLLSHGYIERFIVVRCSRKDTFESISHRFFEQLGIVKVTKRATTSNVEGGISVVKGGHSSSTEEEVYSEFSSPGWVAREIVDMNLVIVIDEFDTIEDSGEKEKFSQFIKILSDSGSHLSLLVVGIAMSAAELLEGHMSVSRSLTEVKLERMSDEELLDIIKKGEDRTGLLFDDKVKKTIVSSSFGFPYFTHLLALKSAEEAVVSDLHIVTEEMLVVGLRKALEDSLASFREKYDNAIGSNETKRKVIFCCAQFGNEVFSAEALRNKYESIFGEKIEPINVSNAIAKAMSDTPDTILRRRKQGSYYFNDPRMPVYIVLRQGQK